MEDIIESKSEKKENMMNLSNKSIYELDSSEIIKEIDYLFGQYDLIHSANYIPEDIRKEERERILCEINILIARSIYKANKRI